METSWLIETLRPPEQSEGKSSRRKEQITNWSMDGRTSVSVVCKRSSHETYSKIHMWKINCFIFCFMKIYILYIEWNLTCSRVIYGGFNYFITVETYTKVLKNSKDTCTGHSQRVFSSGLSLTGLVSFNLHINRIWQKAEFKMGVPCIHGIRGQK